MRFIGWTGRTVLLFSKWRTLKVWGLSFSVFVTVSFFPSLAELTYSVVLVAGVQHSDLTFGAEQ